MMRVDLVARPMGGRSGVGRYAAALGTELAAMGVDVRSTPTLSDALPTALVRLARRRNVDLRAFLASYPLAVSTRPDTLVHVTAQTFATMLWRQPGGAVTVHDLFPEGNTGGGRGAVTRLLDAASRLALRRAEALLTGSEATAFVVRARGFRPKYGIVPTSYGVDHRVFRRQGVPDRFRRSLGLADSVPMLLYVGTEAPRKRVDFLIRLLARLRRSGHPATVLVKVGAPVDTMRRAELHALARSLDVAEAVLWLDHAGDDDLAWLYNLASVYVSAASREGFGLPVLEAMACGAAVAVSDVAAHREVVGAAGFLLPEEDLDAWAGTVGGLLLDRGAARTIGALAEERASLFTWRRTAERTLEVYRQLTKG